MTEALPVVRLVSILNGGGGSFERVRDLLEGSFGPVALQSGAYPFDMSRYYEPEMGEGLSRTWLAFEPLAPADRIADWKLLCSRIEDSFRDGSNRTVNLDPGYMDLGKLVLASFKEAPDKIYMGGGVWAHTCLRYGSGCFRAPGHSFPDFKDGRFDAYLLLVREMYKNHLKMISCGIRSADRV